MINTTGKTSGIKKGADFHYMILSGKQAANYDGLQPETNTLYGLTSLATDLALLQELASGKNHNEN